MGWGIKIVLYSILVYFLAMAGLSILAGSPRIDNVLPAVLFIVALFIYPKIFDKLYEKGGIQSLFLSSIEMATIGAIIGLFYVDSMGFIAIFLGALGVLLVIQAHEIGHFIFCHKYKLDPISLPIRKTFKIDYGITLAAVVHKEARTFKEHTIIALAGPLTNLLLVGVFWALLQIISNSVLVSFFNLMYDFNLYFFMVNIAFEGLPILIRILFPSQR